MGGYIHWTTGRIPVVQYIPLGTFVYKSQRKQWLIVMLNHVCYYPSTGHQKCLFSEHVSSFCGRDELDKLSSEKGMKERALRKRPSALPRPLSGLRLGRFWRGYYLHRAFRNSSKQTDRPKITRSVKISYHANY